MANQVSDRFRAEVASRAGYRCEYCLIHETDTGFSHQIDHVISRKHGGSSDITNLAYACVFCNRHKGSDIASLDPRTKKAVRLFNPRKDSWAEHFRVGAEPLIEPRTLIGAATIRLLRMNLPERLAERQNSKLV